MSEATIIDSAAQQPTHQRQLLAVVLLVVIFFSYIDRVNVSILAVDPLFLEAMGITGQPVQIGLLMTIFLIGYGVGSILLSPLGDILGPRKAMAASIVIWGISLAIGGLAGAFMIMLVSRALLGFGEGMHFPMQCKYVKSWFPFKERGKANSMWQVGMAVAPAVAMPFFTFIIYAVGWRSSFFILMVLGMIPLLLVWFVTTDTPQQSKRINAAELKHIEDGQAEERAQEAALVGTKAPSFRERLGSFSKNPYYWMLILYYAMHCNVYWGLITWMPTYLKEARGFSWAAMGMLASLPWFLGIVTKLLSGILADKLGRRAPMMVLALGGTAVGVFSGVYMTDNYMAAICMGLGIGFFGFSGPAAWTMVQDLVPSHSVSTASGIMAGTTNGISALAPVLIGFVISATGDYNSGMYLIGGMALFGAAVMFILTLKGK